MDAGQTNGRTHHEWLCAFGGWRRWRLFGTCERHVDNDFINWSLVAERLIRPEPKRRRVRGRKIAKSIAARSLPYGTCHCHVTRDFTFLHFAPKRQVLFGREGHRSNRTDEGKIALSIIERQWVRIPSDAYRGRELNLRFCHKAMQYAIPASSDKSADAVVYALIIRSEVLGQESEVGGSTRVCVPKHYQHWNP